MKTYLNLFLLLTLFSLNAFSFPVTGFEELLSKAESDPSAVKTAVLKASASGLPVTIITKTGIMISARGIENNKVVYSVIRNFADIYNGGYSAFFEDLSGIYNPSESLTDYGNGNIVDNTGGMFTPVLSDYSGTLQYLMIPDWTYDRVYLFRADNGNLVDTAFIVSSNPQLQSPKHALQHFNGRNILVSDQISDLVQKFDTNGTYTGIFCPPGGVNNSVLDNIRGIRYRSNKNLLVNVGTSSSISQNTIQQFDTAGNHIGTFIGSNLNSPFDILLRQNDMLITNSSGTSRITRFDLGGNYISSFYSGTGFNFPQQMMQLDNGNIVVAAFSSPSGLMILDSSGNLIRSLTAVTGLRSVYLLGNGHYLTTNATGVHEIDSSSGALIRTVVTGANYQYISLYTPGIVLSVNGNSVMPAGYKLFNNFPNPFNPSTVIKFTVPEYTSVKLFVYDIRGKLITELFNGKKNAGTYEFNFNADELASGIYCCKLEAGKFSDFKKMILVR